MKNAARIQRLLSIIACQSSTLVGMSCQTHTKLSTAVVQKQAMHKNWVKVSSQPPTYCPRGVAADHPTDHCSGEWVYTDDENGTRYFIPLRGLGDRREALVHDALSARSERKLAQVDAEDRKLFLRDAKNAALAGPPASAGVLMAAWATCVAGPNAQPMEKSIQRLGEECQRLGNEWHETKRPDSPHGW